MTNPIGQGTGINNKAEITHDWYVVPQEGKPKSVSAFDQPRQDEPLTKESVALSPEGATDGSEICEKSFQIAATGEKESPVAQQEEPTVNIAERIAVRDGQARPALVFDQLQQDNTLAGEYGNSSRDDLHQEKPHLAAGSGEKELSVVQQKESSSLRRIVPEPKSCFQDELDNIQSEIASREEPSVRGQALVPFTLKDILPSSAGNFGMPKDPDERWAITPRLVEHFITQAKEEVASTVMAKFEERFAAYAKYTDDCAKFANEQQSVFVQRLGHVLRLRETEFNKRVGGLEGEVT